MSAQLEEWIADAGSAEKFGEALEAVEKKLKAKEQENEKLKADLAAKTKTGGKENETVAGAEQGQSKRGNWW